MADGWQEPCEQQVGWVIKHCRWTGVAASPHSEGVITGRSGTLKKGCAARDREAAKMKGDRPWFNFTPWPFMVNHLLPDIRSKEVTLCHKFMVKTKQEHWVCSKCRTPTIFSSLPPSHLFKSQEVCTLSKRGGRDHSEGWQPCVSVKASWAAPELLMLWILPTDVLN